MVQVSPEPHPFFLAATEANGCMKSNPAPAIGVINRLHKSLLQTNSSHGVNCIRRERGGERERETKNRQTDSCQQVGFIQWQDLPKTWSCRKSGSCKGSKWSKRGCSSASFQTRPPPSPGADRSVEHSQRFVDQRSIQRSVQPFTKLEIRGRQADSDKLC